jgi:hypothetical protein
MPPQVDPKLYPGRVIITDTNCKPPVTMINCVGCNRLVEHWDLWKDGDLCRRCYSIWSAKFTEEWLKARLGA